MNALENVLRNLERTLARQERVALETKAQIDAIKAQLAQKTGR